MINLLDVSDLVAHLDKLVDVEVDGFRSMLVVYEVARDGLLSRDHLCNQAHIHVLPLTLGLLGEANGVLFKEADCLVECYLIHLIVQVLGGDGRDRLNLSLIELICSDTGHRILFLNSVTHH